MSLGNIFRTIAPIAAGAMFGPGGAALASGTMGTAIAAGAATGAGIAALSGDDPLMGAVTGGISGYGGGNLGQGFRDFGTKQAMGKLGTTSSVGPMTFEGVRGTGSVIAPPEVLPTGTKALGQGITAALDKPTDFLKSMGGGDALKGGIKTAAATAPAIGGAFAPDMNATTAEQNEMAKYDPNRRLNLNMNTGLRLLAQGGYIEDRHPTLSRTPPGELTEEEINYFYGLDEDEVSDRMYLNRLHSEKMQKYIDEYDMSPRGQFEIIIENLKKTPQGIEKLFKSMTKDKEGMAQGGYLETGMGDGMSDEIPASIGGEQDVLLSENEFVIPADVVSGLGNGSSDAGAEKLFAMMDRVRKARTGTKEMGKEITAERLMPA